MKQLLALCAALLLSIGVVSAQNTTTHIVDRGETLASIAKKYGTTDAEIIRLNPEAGQYIYVGQELTIPAVTGSSNAVASENTNSNSGNALLGTIKVPNEETKEDKPGFQPVFSLEYGFLPKEKGVKGTSFAYKLTAGFNYYFLHKDRGPFAGVQIGYNTAYMYSYAYASHEVYNYNMTQKTESHFIALPFSVGYRLEMPNSKFGITPYAGLGVNFCVAGKIKTEGRIDGSNINDEKEFKKKVGIDARVGLQLSFNLFDVGAAYVFRVNDNQKMYFGKKGYFAVSIGWGF